MFLSSLRLRARTTDRGGHYALMTERRLRLFGRGSPARRTDDAVVFSEAERAVAPPPGLAPALTIDALGRKCPIPIIMLADRIRDVPLGAIVSVLADDPAAYTDVPSWCAMKAHEFVYAQDLPRGWALFIRRTI
jgi:tRNA 2-thiouridine synthesizing protein A